MLEFEFLSMEHVHSMNKITFFEFIGVVAKIEKNLTDHTEFLNYKNEMDKWLAIANETLENCAGIGNEPDTRQKLTTVTVMHYLFLVNLSNFQMLYKTMFFFYLEPLESIARRSTFTQSRTRCIH